MRASSAGTAAHNARRCGKALTGWIFPALVGVLLTLAAPVLGQQQDFLEWDEDIIEAADNVLQKILHGQEVELPLPDPAQTDAYLRELQSQLEGEYVLDLAPLKRVADFLLPLLEAHESLKDLGAWLRSRRDYFDVLEEWAVTIPAPNSISPTNQISVKPGTNSALRITGPPDKSATNKTAPADTLRRAVANPVTVQIVPPEDDEPVPVNVVIVPPRNATQATKTPSSLPAPSSPPSPRSLGRENPSPEAVRAAWGRQISARAQPAGASTWVPRLKPIFIATGVPAELVWLAEVESGFDPRARSPVGAVGLFQLMPVTARSLGLSTFPFDQRKSPEPAARAAALYLHQLFDQFGDWPLALAAYNAGPARVRALVTAYEARTFETIARHLPAETQLYVPKLDAILQRREGRSLKDLPAATGLVTSPK